MWSAKLPLFGLVAQSITDGPGFRFTLFTQGCPHGCEGCHNPESWDRLGGTDYTLEEIVEDFEKNSFVDGVTFSGGEPFLHPKELTFLARYFKEKGKNIICYTGYLYEDLLQLKNPEVKEFLEEIDLLIDGPFILEKRDLSLSFRGSSNQRLLPLTEKGEALLREIQDW